MTERRHSEKARWRRDLVLMAAVLIALLGVYVLNQSRQESRDEQARAENREAILDGIQANCEADRKFRIQYKVRGRAEKKLLVLFLELARQNLEAGGPDAQLNQDFIDEFGPLLERIRIITPPNCTIQRERIEAALISP